MWAMMDGYGWGWWGMGHMLLWWVLIILGIIVLVRWLARSSPGQAHPPETALDILKKRYARGEIDREEFDLKKRDLGG
jgi:putative membrane protein